MIALFTLTEKLSSSCGPKDDGCDLMEMKHPGAFTDTLQMVATSCKFKTLSLYESHQICSNAEARINGSGCSSSDVVAPVVPRSCVVCHQHKILNIFIIVLWDQ